MRRRTRFERAHMPPLRLTDRDYEILRSVHRHRLLSSRHLVSLAGGSPQGVLRRLQALFHHGYLDRPRAQLDWYMKGSKPMVYALGRKGARAIGASRSRWSQRNRRLGRGFMRHTLAVSGALLAIELACRHSGGVEFLSAETLFPSPQGGVRPPFRMRVSFRYRGRRETLGIIPDALFAIRYPGRPAGRETSYFFLEVDRGTMPVRRKSLRQTSVARKYLAYHAAWKQGLHTRLFSFPNFRVLLVTASAKRRQTLARALAETLGSGKRLFLFDPATLSEAARLPEAPPG